MEQLKQKVEISEHLSETSTNDETSCRSDSRLDQASSEQEESKIPLHSLSEREQKTIEAKVSLMRKRWEGEIESIYSEQDQILIDDENLVEYSAMVQERAAIEQEKITKSIKESLALLRRYYEALNMFDNHMLQRLQQEEERLMQEAKDKIAKKKGELPRLNKRKTRQEALNLADSRNKHQHHSHHENCKFCSM